MNYTDYVATIANLMVTQTTNTEFVQILPAAADYANNRITRECDFVYLQATDTGTVVANNRDFTLPSNLGTFQVVDQINVFTPSGSTTTRNPVVPASLETINTLWPSGTSPSATTVPQFFAIKSQSATGQIVVTFGPSPGDSFTAEVIGDVFPAVISESNTTTFYSTYIPDVLIAATMIFMTGYQKNFSAQGDDPKMSVSWESQYQALMQSTQLIEARKAFSSQGWTSKAPAPLAAAPR